MKPPLRPKIRILLSVVLVLAVAIFVARVFWPKPSPHPKAHARAVVKKKRTVVSVPAAPVKESPRLAIILDDWGANESLLKDAIAVDRPMTLSVIPHLPHSTEIAEGAHAAGLHVMLHMPMQAKSLKAPREPHTILTTSSDAEITKYLEAALADVPYVEGVNNHQGSAATSDLRVMRTVLANLEKKGLYFVDSKVIATSVCAQAAKETGIRFASRDVFIDNVPTVEAVQAQLRQAVNVALKSGDAIVIGHDKKNTLAAIRAMVPEIEKSGVKIVPAEDLLG